METTEFRSCTPPQYIKNLRAKEAPVLLEDRLEHFLSWLAERDFIVVEGHGVPDGYGESTRIIVSEYVNG